MLNNFLKIFIAIAILGTVFFFVMKKTDMVLPVVKNNEPASVPQSSEYVFQPPATTSLKEQVEQVKQAPVQKLPALKQLPQTAPVSLKREPREVIVKILSSTNVEPKNITIHIGDTITFINEDTELHWPGADPHPTHSSLPVFDALGGISRGQSYSHTFRTVGTFGYHEHLLDDPPVLGFISVLP